MLLGKILWNDDLDLLVILIRGFLQLLVILEERLADGRGKRIMARGSGPRAWEMPCFRSVGTLLSVEWSTLPIDSDLLLARGIEAEPSLHVAGTRTLYISSIMSPFSSESLLHQK